MSDFDVIDDMREKLYVAQLKIGDLERTIEFVAEAKAAGKVITYYPNGIVSSQDFVTCPECGGQGWYVEGYDPPSQEPCPVCDAMGHVPISEVKIRDEERSRCANVCRGVAKKLYEYVEQDKAMGASDRAYRSLCAANAADRCASLIEPQESEE